MEYPTSCTTQLCYGVQDEYKPTVKPMEIYKSSGDTYTVTGTDRSSKGDTVYYTGMTTKKQLSGSVVTTSKLPICKVVHTHMP